MPSPFSDVRTYALVPPTLSLNIPAFHGVICGANPHVPTICYATVRGLNGQLREPRIPAIVPIYLAKRAQVLDKILLHNHTICVMNYRLAAAQHVMFDKAAFQRVDNMVAETEFLGKHVQRRTPRAGHVMGAGG